MKTIVIRCYKILLSMIKYHLVIVVVKQLSYRLGNPLCRVWCFQVFQVPSSEKTHRAGKGPNLLEGSNS